MEDLKFKLIEEKSIAFRKEAPYEGPYSYATQNTVLYDDFGYVMGEKEKMKIYVKCDKIFYSSGDSGEPNSDDAGEADESKGNNIGILSGRTMQIYRNLEKVDEYEIGPVDINCFLTGSEFREIEPDVLCVFSVGKEKIKIKRDVICLGSKECPNSIHIDGCRYILASKGDLIIIGNDQSMLFLYFVKKELCDIEEMDGVSLRMNLEDYSTEMAVDIKFDDESFILKDKTMNTRYSVNDPSIAQKDDAPVHMSEYRLSDDQKVIERISDSEGDVKDDYIKDDSQSAVEDKDKSIMKDDSQSIVKDKGQSAVEDDSSKNIAGDKASEKSLFSREDKKIEAEPKKSSVFNSMLGKMQIAKNEPLLPKSKLFDDDKSSSAKDIQNQLSSRLGKERKTELTAEEERNLEDFRKLLENKIGEVKGLSASIQEFEEPRLYEYLPAKIECSQLYNLIYNSDIKKYNESLGYMITKLEILNNADSSNVQETIKYVNSYIGSLGRCNYAVHYKDPLIAKFNSVVRIGGDSSDDFQAGIGLLNVNKDIAGQRRAAGVAKGTAEANKGRAPEIPKNPFLDKSTLSTECPATDDSHVEIRNPQQEPNYVADAAAISQEPIFNPQNQIPASTGSIFENNDIQNTMHGDVQNTMLVQDTSKLFGSVAMNFPAKSMGATNFPANSMNATNFPVNSANDNPGTGLNPENPASSANSSSSGSTFSRFAGSRRMLN